MRRFVLFLFDGFALNLKLDKAPVKLVHDFRLRVHLDFDFRRSLVNQVDGFVRQKSVSDIAMAQLCCSNDGRIGDIYIVVLFIALFETTQDGDRRFDTGFSHQYFLKSSLKSRIFFNVLSVFIQRSRADAMQLSTGQCRFEHIAGIHRAFSLTSPHHGVQLINKDNGLAFVFCQIFENIFKALFKLSAELGTG